MKIQISVGKHVMRAELYENETAENWYQLLPVTYRMMNLYGREMCYRMGNGSLPVQKIKNRESVIGDICYRPPAGSLVIQYEKNGETSEQEIIGHIEEDISFLKEMNDMEVTFEKEK